MMSWLSGSSKSQRGDFNVVIYESDYKQLCTWVLKKTDIETGGDLFGLWADKHTAVIQFVVGPGQNCRRSSVSFYQDINYLEKIGEHMTIREGVCHIGEWHSHHQLGLARPSGGDENTVWNNMPTYNLKRFVIFIANLEQLRKDSYNVNIGCFLFELESVNGKEKQLPVLQGTFKILKNENLLNRKLLRKRDEGAEHDKIEISMECLKMEISPEGPPQVTYVTKTSSSSGNKRPKTEGESGKKNNKKSRKDARASSVGNENTQGKKSMTPDDFKKGKSTGAEGTHKTATSDSNEGNDSHGSQPDDPKQGKSTGAEGTHKTATSDSNEGNDSHGSQPDDPKQGKLTGAEGTQMIATSDSNETNDSHGSEANDPKQGKSTRAEDTHKTATSDSNEPNDSHGSQADDPKQGKSTGVEGTHKTATSDSNEGNDSHGSQPDDPKQGKLTGAEGTQMIATSDPNEPNDSHGSQPDDPKQGKSTGVEGTHKTATSDSNEGNDSHGSQPDDPKQGKLTGAEGTQMIATSDSNETNDSHGSEANDPKQGKSTRAEDTHKTATSDSNEGNDSHGSQAENSNELLTNDEGNAQTSGGEGTNLASDPLPQEKEMDHEDQPGIQLLESKANVTRASHDKTQEGTSNKESNDDKRNVNISEVEGENSTDDQQLPEKDQEHETQPNSRKPEGDANDHNASHDRTEEGKSSKVSNKDGGKAKIEGEKSADNAEPPSKDSNKAFNSLDQDQTSRSNKNVSGQGETPMKDKQTKSRIQRSDRGANKQVKPHDSDKDKLREGQKNDASRAGSSQPIPEKSSKATKATPKSKSGAPPSSSVPGKAVPVKPADKGAKKKVEEKGGIGKKGGPTKYKNKTPSK